MYIWDRMSNFCRICAKELGAAKGLCLFDESLRSRKSLMRLQKITGLELKEQKYMPGNMCTDCQLSLKNAFQFRKTCRRAQIILAYRIRTDTDETWHNSSESCSSDSKYFEDTQDSNSLPPLSPVQQMVEDTCDFILSHNESPPKNKDDDDEDEKPIPIDAIDDNSLESDQDIPTLSSPIDDELRISFNLRHKELTKSKAADDDDIEFQSEQPSSFIQSSQKSEKQQVKGARRKTRVQTSKTVNSRKTRKPSANALDVVETLNSNSDVSISNDDDDDEEARNIKKSDKYICELCGQSFDVKHYFESHVNRHNGEKPFKCNICPETFYTQQSLKRHLLKHAGALPFACRFCPRRFLDSSAKVRHERMHTNDRPYKCNYCDKAFTTNYILKNHLLTHTGERSFSCNLCTRSFVQKKHLTTHYKSLSHKQKEEEARTAQE